MILFHLLMEKFTYYSAYIQHHPVKFQSQDIHNSIQFECFEMKLDDRVDFKFFMLAYQPVTSTTTAMEKLMKEYVYMLKKTSSKNLN